MEGSCDNHQFFLLPYIEEPTYSLKQPIQEVCKSYKYSEETGNEDSKELYETCHIQRTGNGLMENGIMSSEGPRDLYVRKGSFLLLRPPENSLRPSVGKAVYFWKSAKNAEKAERSVRVQWCYRAEDLSDRPTEAVGEDEVFETEHFDDVELEAIAGCCQVSSYSEWVTIKEKEKDAHDKAERLDRDLPKNKNIPDEALSDTESSYGDNYASAAIHYYCRRFYDPLRQLFAVSKFEDENADPAEELNQYYQVDDDFNPDEAVSSSEDDGVDDDTCDETAELNSIPAKRKRSARRQRGTDGYPQCGEKVERTSQFLLPADLGSVEELPCRGAEKEKIRRFLEDAIKESADGVHGGSRCLYISGVPGTGKTATVREVVRTLNARRAVGELPAFEAIEVNAMSLPDPNLVYSELYKAMTGSQGFAPMHAAQLLEKRFADEDSAPAKKSRKRRVGFPSARERGKCIILILDEMDVLVSRKQKVLYDILEWPTRKNARMAVIGIANTMDLPERMLPRLGSRLGLNRLTYPPYNSEQLTTILNMKVEEKTNIKFAPAAIKLCAQKVGAVSGDVRRALEIIRRATEIVGDEKGKRRGKRTVTAKHINMAFNDMAGGARLVALKQLSLFERLFLVSAISLARSEGSFAIDVTCTLSAISTKALDEAMRYSKFFEESGIPCAFELEEVCWRLTGQRFVILEKAAVYSDSRVIVNVSADDCSFALSDCELSMAILRPKNADA